MIDNLILVIYVGVAGIRSEDISTYTTKIASKIIPDTFIGEVIVIPSQSFDTKIECINPKYITDVDLILKHTELMNNLKKNLQHNVDELKKINNG